MEVDLSKLDGVLTSKKNGAQRFLQWKKCFLFMPATALPCKIGYLNLLTPKKKKSDLFICPKID